MESEQARQVARMIELALITGNRDRARQLVDRAFDGSIFPDRIDGDTYLDQIFGNKIVKILKSKNVLTVRQLNENREENLALFSDRTRRSIEKRLSE